MLIAVILHGTRVLRDRYRHLVRELRDCQRAFDLLDIVVALQRAFVQRVSERVRARANNRLASRHVPRHAFVLNKALAAYLHFFLRQRLAVVDLLSVGRGQRHFARVDYELVVIRRRNFIFLRLVNRANRTIRKVCRIGSSILSRRANRDIAEISLCRRTGKAGNALLASIISHRAAVRRQLDVLIIVESNHVLGRIRANRDRLGGSRYRRAARNLGGGFRHRRVERLAVKGLGFLDRSFGSVPVVLHRIAQVGLLLVIDPNNVLAFIRSNRQRAVLRLFELIPIFRLESESVFIDLTSVQRTDGIGFGIVYYAVVVMLNPIAVGVRPIVHVDNRVFATYELLHWIIITRISVAGYTFKIFVF